MAADFLDCNLNDLLAASKCFRNCVSEDDRLAALLYVRTVWLAAAGGTDYTGTGGLTTLMDEASCWTCAKNLDAPTRQAIQIYLDMQNAIDAGADVQSADVQSGAYCLRCVDMETKRKLLLYLECALDNVR